MRVSLSTRRLLLQRGAQKKQAIVVVLRPFINHVSQIADTVRRRPTKCELILERHTLRHTAAASRGGGRPAWSVGALDKQLTDTGRRRVIMDGALSTERASAALIV